MVDQYSLGCTRCTRGEDYIGGIVGRCFNLIMLRTRSLRPRHQILDKLLIAPSREIGIIILVGDDYLYAGSSNNGLYPVIGISDI